MTTSAARADIHAELQREIRRLSVAHITITLDVALHNWQYFFEQGRGAEARSWWAVAHRLMCQG